MHELICVLFQLVWEGNKPSWWTFDETNENSRQTMHSLSIGTIVTKCLYKWIIYVGKAWTTTKPKNRAWRLIHIVDRVLKMSMQLAWMLDLNFWNKVHDRTFRTRRYRPQLHWRWVIFVAGGLSLHWPAYTHVVEERTSLRISPILGEMITRES